ncbi:Bax inhibitor-1 family protein [Sphingomonas aracearum]|uniref:BAX inhibitor (BI)-1/YccA family protein n=1 Tax=Sphingomonas aracearum TaxID=2283317 RepID=A0A369VZE6_9SPHN|nr:Bax inhibitor-1/YccA family protein [Sphingomonas aracearum]RDE06490.1 BAX inhibitor (BI)-1/YccA family protein [Sphingomonas aracearum]
MANWSDPRPTAAPFGVAAGTRSDAYDAGLRSYMLSVYNYMISAVLLTGIVSLSVAYTGMWRMLVSPTGGMSGLGMLFAFSPLAIVFAMSFGANRMSSTTLQALFWAYAALLGVSLSTIFIAYTASSVAGAFFATAAGFAGLSLYGYTTQRSLGAMGTFLIVGLVGLIVASLLNLWLQSGPLGLVISIVGVLIFAGLTAYDTQRIKSMYSHVAGTPAEGHTKIMSALSLYLDFINMFLFVLRLFGSSRN